LAKPHPILPDQVRRSGFIHDLFTMMLCRRVAEELTRTMGDEKAAWARLLRAECKKELRWYHEHFNTPDDLAERPPELDGGVWNP
jgi:hypothetical protein